MPHRMLLADDSLTIQKVVELTFSDSGFELMAVGRGDNAVQALESFRPDIVLADVVMPGLSGYEVCERVKGQPGGEFVPVVLLTGTFEPFDRARAERAGCDSIVTKPFDSHALSNLVRDLLAKAATARSSAPAPAADRPEDAPPPQEGSPAVSGGDQTIAVRPFSWGDPMTEPAPVEAPAPASEPASAIASGHAPVSEMESELLYATTAFPIPSASELASMEARKNEADAAKLAHRASEIAAQEPTPFEFDETLVPPSDIDEPEPISPPPTDESPAHEAHSQETTLPLPRIEPLPAAQQADGDSHEAPPNDLDPPLQKESERELEAAFAMEPDSSEGIPEAISEPEELHEAEQLRDPEPTHQAEPVTEPSEVPHAPEPPGLFDGEEPMHRDIEEDIAAFERSGNSKIRPSMWDELPTTRLSSLGPGVEAEVEGEVETQSADSNEAKSATPIELEELAAGASLSDLIPSGASSVSSRVPSTGAVPLSDADVERVARRMVELLSEKVVRDIAWDVVPEIAERFVRARIRELEAEPR